MIVVEPHAVASGTVEIRQLKSIEDCRRMKPVMERVWGTEFVVPDHLSFKIAKYGGVVLGAFLDGQMIGFTLSFPMTYGYLHGLYLHMIGVVPEHHSLGVGARLMLALGQTALIKGHRMLTWTYDPLEGPNARLYIGKLGAVCNEYMPNYYGSLQDQRNKGAETDRFQVQWWVDTPRIHLMLEESMGGVDPRQLSAAGLQEYETSEEAAVVNEVHLRPDGLLVSEPPKLDLKAKELRLRIPSDFQTLKAGEPSLAESWRMLTRSVFTAYFARGWTAVGFLPGEAYNTYILQK